jgi:hypothetical protein
LTIKNINFDLNAVLHIKRYRKYSFGQLLTLIGLIVMESIPLFFVAYFNVHAVDFRFFIKTVMGGYDMKVFYHQNPSIFIKIRNIGFNRSDETKETSLLNSSIVDETTIIDQDF